VFIKPQAARAIDATALPGVQTLPKAPAAVAPPPPEAATPAAQAPPAAPPVQTPPAAPSSLAAPPIQAAAPPKAPPPPASARVATPPPPRPNSPEMVAAVNRVKYVIEQYAAALNNRNEQALGDVRTGATDAERALLKAREVKMSIEVSSVDVSGTTAIATCQQNIDATAADGKPLRTSGTATFQLVRQPTGWVITEIK
jgi:hypothetical protein